MRLRAPAVLTALTVLALAAGGGLAVAGTVPPSVGYIQIAGSGPDDLFGTDAAGFAPGDTATMTLTDTDGTGYAFAPLSVDARGRISTPVGYRTPSVLPVGTYRLVVADQSGDVASSGPITIVPPGLSAYLHGAPGDVLDLGLEGVPGDPGITRTVTIDGTPVTASYHETLLSTGCCMGLDVTLPDTLTPGDHALHLTQAGAPAAGLDATVVVPRPTLQAAPADHTAVWNLSGSRNPVQFEGFWFGVHADVSVTMTDAAHHTTTLGTLDGSADLRVALPNSPPGDLTFTATNRLNGVVTTTTTTPIGHAIRVGRSSSTTTIVSGDQLVSPNGDTAVRIGTDGNLVLDRGWTPRWTSLTQGHPGSVLAFQADGSIAVVTAGSRPAVVWSSHSPTTDRPTRLTAQDDGNLVLYSAHGRALWSTRTAGGDESTLASGSVLGAGGRLGDPTTGFELRMQVDGNLVLYQLGSRDLPLFDTHTSHQPGASVILQSDGNLVVYSVAGKALWSNHVFPGPGARLAMQGDGNLVEYGPNGQAVWSARTVR